MWPTPPWPWRCWPGSRPPAACMTTPAGPWSGPGCSPTGPAPPLSTPTRPSRPRSAPCAGATWPRRRRGWRRASTPTAASARWASPLGSPHSRRAYLGLGRSAEAAALAERYAAVTPRRPRRRRWPWSPAAGRSPSPTTPLLPRPSRSLWPPTPRPWTPSRRPGPACCTGPSCGGPAGGSPPASNSEQPWTRLCHGPHRLGPARR